MCATLNNVKIEHRINLLAPASGQFRHNLVAIINENAAFIKENSKRLNIVCKVPLKKFHVSGDSISFQAQSEKVDPYDI